MVLMPLVGLPACRHDMKSGIVWRRITDSYLRACVLSGAGEPVVIPGTGSLSAIVSLLASLDGIILTGSASNVETWRYDKDRCGAGSSDRERDRLSIAITRAALRENVPILAICRGIQELNVSLGGTLHPRLHEVPGYFDHRSPKGSASISLRFAPAHPILPEPGSMLAGWIDAYDLPDQPLVNSLHGQAIDDLADGLVVEAYAPDGAIEAVRVSAPIPSLGVMQPPDFAYGVQWHPEWSVLSDPLSSVLFQKFAEATARRRDYRSQLQRRDMLVEHARSANVIRSASFG